MFLFGCGGVLLGLFLGLLIGSAILRAATALANRIFKPTKRTDEDTFGQWDDWDSGEPGPGARKNADRTIPEPGIATGMLITFLWGVVHACCYGILGGLMALAFDDMGARNEWLAPLVLFCFSLPASYLALALLLVVTLPTTFGRAALVAFLNYAIGLGIALVIGTAVSLAWSAVGP
ncbi:hypothetical protein VT84_08285 [Gemmata sp. SH-PL17]|uniref:hypothetical protein n=1 Tax=Gemmata sp. SH-PL17 TaxID=1630693 RepID=UPI00078D77F9|nr:hypothetical protein [Gemmata sp. SH-PL17]AMV24380.1 hypothetical protein VT84_08285 [Gemmata sp. SH-PL17]